MKYLGKTHNIWHRMTLNLEEMSVDDNIKHKIKEEKLDCYEFQADDTLQTVIL